MTNVWCVRAAVGQYAEFFRAGGFAAIGWIDQVDLAGIRSRDELRPLYCAASPNDTSNVVIGQQVGQIARFLLEIQPGDYVVTPAQNTEHVFYGRVLDNPTYLFQPGDPTCPYPHRRRVEWATEPLRRGSFSVPLQNTLRSSLTVFYISQRDEFLSAIDRGDLIGARRTAVSPPDPYKVVLERVLELDATEFEILVGHLLTALGFDGSEVIGKSGDGGVDVIGEFDVSGFAKVKVFVQAKRYKLGSRVAAGTVKQLRQAIPFGGQGAFITTADYQSAAAEVALEPGFPRIGLINGRQLVDLLVEHWEDIPDDFRDLLGLRPGLVLA